MMTQLTVATLMPAIISAIILLIWKKTGMSKKSYVLQQIIIGIAFGLFAVLSTEYGIPMEDGYIINVRDSGPLCAGLMFGAPAGVIAGCIGGLHRWLVVYWGGGMATRVACSLATFIAGICGGLFRNQIFENRRAGIFVAVGIGTTMEVLHMLLVLATNLDDVPTAFGFVQECAFIMILCNGIALGLAAVVCNLSQDRKLFKRTPLHISKDFTVRLLIYVAIAFTVTFIFTQQIIYRITSADAELYRQVMLYMIVFMEVLIYTALFVLVYQLLKRKVIHSMHLVNKGLNEISEGNLDTVIDVRTYKEFEELSDDVNSTVNTLKKYIKEAEERIDRELEFGRQLQHSVLPDPEKFCDRHNELDLHASMKAAKEVGGDFFDFYRIDQDNIAFIVADVSGKGIPAAMFMMRAKTIIRDLAEDGRPVDEIFRIANAKLCEGNDAGMFMTAWMGKLNVPTGELTFVNAGHNPPVYRSRDGRPEYLATKPNFVLGGMDISKCTAHTIELRAGDAFYLYTDGVTEATDAQEMLFGEERLLDSLEKAKTASTAKAVCQLVSEDIDSFVKGEPQSDDITMLCIRMRALREQTSITLNADNTSYAALEQFIDHRVEEDEISMKTANRIHVAVDEIWANIVMHSNAEDVKMSLSREEGRVTVVLEDNGKAFDPIKDADAPDITLSAEEREIGGLGIHMVKKLTSDLSYQRIEDKNVLTMVFEV